VALGRPLAEQQDRPDLLERSANLVDWVCTQTMLPYSKSRRQVLEADVVARTRQLSRGGWAAALDDIRPGTRCLAAAACRSTPTTTRRARSPALSCCLSR
jgi:hypothetical protein